MGYASGRPLSGSVDQHALIGVWGFIPVVYRPGSSAALSQIKLAEWQRPALHCRGLSAAQGCLHQQPLAEALGPSPVLQNRCPGLPALRIRRSLEERRQGVSAQGLRRFIDCVDFILPGGGQVRSAGSGSLAVHPGLDGFQKAQNPTAFGCGVLFVFGCGSSHWPPQYDGNDGHFRSVSDQKIRTSVTNLRRPSGLSWFRWKSRPALQRSLHTELLSRRVASGNLCCQSQSESQRGLCLQRFAA